MRATGSGVAAGAPGAAGSPRHYVALGDSYTAAPLVPVTDVAGGCFRSTGNYPTLVAHALGTTLDDRSCGAAETRDFQHSQHPGVPPQLSALHPGVDLVTIGVGGNDGRLFGRLVESCPRLAPRDPDGAPCRTFMRAHAPAHHKDALLATLAHTSRRVTALLREVRDRVPQAQVLVVGYPQIVSADNVCAALPLARGDYAYAQQVSRALTQVLRRAAATTGATYVDVWSASKGHDICSDDPWVNGAVDDQQRAARYHPFAEEQQAVAALVVKKVRASG